MTTAAVAQTVETFPDKTEWLAARRTGLGSSDAPVVLGLSPYKSAYALWAEKVGLVEPSDVETEWQEWGIRLEPAIAAKYAEATGREVLDRGRYRIVRHPETPWLLASPDRELAPVNGEGLGVLEIKTAAAFKADEWRDDAPLAYRVQLQHQLLVTGYAWGSLAVLLGGQAFRWQDQRRHERLLQLLVEQLEAFWDRVQRGIPPPVDGSDLTKEVLQRLHPKPTPGVVVALPPEAAAWDRQREHAKAAIEAAEATKQEAENLLRAAIGDAEAGVLPGGITFTHKLVRKRAHQVAETSYRQLRRVEKRA